CSSKYTRSTSLRPNSAGCPQPKFQIVCAMQPATSQLSGKVTSSNLSRISPSHLFCRSAISRSFCVFSPTIGNLHLCSTINLENSYRAVVGATPKGGFDDAYQSRRMRLRAAYRELCRRSGSSLSVPLSRMPAANREHLWDRRVLSTRKRQGGRRCRGLHSTVGKRVSRHLLLLSPLRVDRVLEGQP